MSSVSTTLLGQWYAIVLRCCPQATLSMYSTAAIGWHMEATHDDAPARETHAEYRACTSDEIDYIHYRGYRTCGLTGPTSRALATRHVIELDPIWTLP